MRAYEWISSRASRGIALAVALIVSGTVFAVSGAGGSSAAPQASVLEATIFSYDGHDFIRTQTTLVTEEGASAVNTKLERTSAAYKALVQKRSYTGEATVFGKKYDANYAPLTGKDGRVTGALFVAVAR